MRDIQFDDIKHAGSASFRKFQPSFVLPIAFASQPVGDQMLSLGAVSLSSLTS